MTDLKGEFLSRLMTQKERQDFFHFLERANWLIFQDAYPQLLIYKESIKRNKSLFYLLSAFSISTFMETIWNKFWENRDSYLITVGLIINEQGYIEDRLVQNPEFQKQVLGKLEFFLQDLLSFNQILFPYRDRRLAGLTVHQFESISERILIGKRLYKVLYQEPKRMEQILEWAKDNPHTGSRKDYWPDVFNSINEGIPGFPYQLRLTNCKLKKGAAKLFSPTINQAWKNVIHEQTEEKDWFQDWKVAGYLEKEEEIINGEIKDEYCRTLEQFELASLAKKAIQIFD